MNKHIHSLHRQYGIGLIEVLVSLVIIAVGSLGVLGLQSRAMQQSQETLHFSQASFLAGNLMDRMRTNHSYNVYNPDSNAYEGTFSSTNIANVSTNCLTHFCTHAQLAAWDVKDWLENAPVDLPNWSATVTISDADIGSVHSVSVQIDIIITTTTEVAGSTETFSFTSRL